MCYCPGSEDTFAGRTTCTGIAVVIGHRCEPDGEREGQNEAARKRPETRPRSDSSHEGGVVLITLTARAKQVVGGIQCNIGGRTCSKIRCWQWLIEKGVFI